jgi:uncharacterized cupredoxin-like copper-binding protein
MLATSLMVGMTLTACGNGADTTEPGGEPTAMEDAGNGASTGAEALQAKTLDTFVFEPNAWSTTAGSTATLTLDNTGQALEHTWVLLPQTATMDEAIALADPPPADAILYELRVPAGETASGTFTAPAEAGSYIVVCAVAGHAAGGMTGTLTVN